MSSPAEQALDPDALPQTVREAFLAVQAEGIGLRAQIDDLTWAFAQTSSR